MITQVARDFKNNIGNTLQLQASHSNKDERFYVKLVGFLENKSIIVTTPRVDGAPLKIEERQNFIVRMMSGSAAKVFTCTAIFSSQRPYPHLHLTYPDALESITIRKAERVNCKLIVTVHNKQGHEGISASINDISTAGAQLFSKESLGTVGDEISIDCKFSIAGIEQYLTIIGIIRRTVDSSKDENSFEYGIEFSSIADNDKIILTAYVYEQILNVY